MRVIFLTVNSRIYQFYSTNNIVNNYSIIINWIKIICICKLTLYIQENSFILKFCYYKNPSIWIKNEIVIVVLYFLFVETNSVMTPNWSSIVLEKILFHSCHTYKNLDTLSYLISFSRLSEEWRVIDQFKIYFHQIFWWISTCFTFVGDTLGFRWNPHSKNWGARETQMNFHLNLKLLVKP